MALQDHFRPPLSVRRHWHAFYKAWATYISSDLNQRLPEGYFTEANVQFGIAIDVATCEEAGTLSTDNASPGDGIDYPSPGEARGCGRLSAHSAAVVAGQPVFASRLGCDVPSYISRATDDDQRCVMRQGS